MANGVRVVGRSLKYHRPRGIVAAGAEEPNAIVQLDGDDDEPNARATTLPLREGLSARSVNCWPSVGFDLGAINDRLSPLLPAGFYYKTFMGLPGGWNFYGRFVRRMAGLGTALRERRGSAHVREAIPPLRRAGRRGGSGRDSGGAGRGPRRRPGDARRRRTGAGWNAPRRRGGDRRDVPAAEWVAGAVAELDSLSRTSSGSMGPPSLATTTTTCSRSSNCLPGNPGSTNECGRSGRGAWW